MPLSWRNSTPFRHTGGRALSARNHCAAALDSPQRTERQRGEAQSDPAMAEHASPREFSCALRSCHLPVQKRESQKAGGEVRHKNVVKVADRFRPFCGQIPQKIRPEWQNLVAFPPKTADPSTKICGGTPQHFDGKSVEFSARISQIRHRECGRFHMHVKNAEKHAKNSKFHVKNANKNAARTASSTACVAEGMVSNCARTTAPTLHYCGGH